MSSDGRFFVDCQNPGVLHMGMKAIKQLRDVELKTCGYAPGYRTFNLVVEAADGSRYQLRLNKKDSRFLYHELEQMYKAAGPDSLD